MPSFSRPFPHQTTHTSIAAAAAAAVVAAAATALGRWTIGHLPYCARIQFWSEIILERWEEEEQNSQGPTTRSRGATTQQSPDGSIVKPVLRQTITITRDRSTNPESYHVAGGPLVLGFDVLFLQDPDPTRDIVIGTPALQLYASQVWAMA
ncbi:hypothetical protein OQA88_12682 [Cercophora sp. LCS_1]